MEFLLSVVSKFIEAEFVGDIGACVVCLNLRLVLVEDCLSGVEFGLSEVGFLELG